MVYFSSMKLVVNWFVKLIYSIEAVILSPCSNTDGDEDDEYIGTARYSNTIHTLWTILSGVVDGDILLEVTRISNRL